MGDVVQFRRARLTGLIPPESKTPNDETRDDWGGLIGYAKSGGPIINPQDGNIPPRDTEPPGAA